MQLRTESRLFEECSKVIFSSNGGSSKREDFTEEFPNPNPVVTLAGLQKALKVASPILRFICLMARKAKTPREPTLLQKLRKDARAAVKRAKATLRKAERDRNSLLPRRSKLSKNKL